MEGGSKKEEPSKKFLDLMPNEKEWLVRGREASEEKKLELRLGPPGDWHLKENSTNDIRGREESLLSLGYFTNPLKNSNPSAGAKRGFLDTETGGVNSINGSQNQKISSDVLFPSPWPCSSPPPSAFQKTQQKKTTFLQFQTSPSLPVMRKEFLQTNETKVEVQDHEQKGSPSSVFSNATAANNPNSSRTTSGPVVGWPPIRSFRKNIASSSLKPVPESKDAAPSSPVVGWPPIRSFRKNIASTSSKPVPESKDATPTATEKLPEPPRGKGMFVKINMDGVPIGRKVDLNACNSYEKLTRAVDELFRGLLAAQRDPSIVGSQDKAKEMEGITDLLDGSGEYTLVYEDNEGDRMLVGDVPWEMFVSTVKRLRVLKSSELSLSSLESSNSKTCLQPVQ